MNGYDVRLALGRCVSMATESHSYCITWYAPPSTTVWRSTTDSPADGDEDDQSATYVIGTSFPREPRTYHDNRPGDDEEFDAAKPAVSHVVTSGLSE